MTVAEFEAWMKATGFVTLEAAAVAIGGPGGNLGIGTVCKWRIGVAPVRAPVARLCRAMLRHPDFLDEVKAEVAEHFLSIKPRLRLVGPEDDIQYEPEPDPRDALPF